MDEEKTIYDSGQKNETNSNIDTETTHLDTCKNQKDENKNDISEKKTSDKKKPKWKRVAIGTAGSFAIGLGASMLFSSATPENNDNVNDTETNNEGDTNGNDVEENISTSTSDDISFNEAFAAARAEMGSGGAFEWYGNLYSTYTEEEWGNMSDEQRDDYLSQYNLNDGDSQISDYSENVTNNTNQESGEENAENSAIENNDDNNQTTQEEVHEEEITQNTDNENLEIPNDIVGDVDENQIDYVEEIAQSTDEQDVEILGVAQTDDIGSDIEGVTIDDGQEVAVIDVGDDTGDAVTEEIATAGTDDISDANPIIDETDSSLIMEEGIFTQNDNNLDIDYTNDADIYEA